MGYWGFRHYAYEQALYEYEAGYAGWEAQTVTTADVCERSLRLFRADAAVPFTSKRRAASEHLKRVEHVLMVDYGPSSEWLMGASTPKWRDYAYAKGRNREVLRTGKAASGRATMIGKSVTTRRWFQFSLRTLFVVMTVTATIAPFWRANTGVGRHSGSSMNWQN